jgi:hypothetical protein
MAITDLDRVLLLVQQIGDVDAATAEPILPNTPGSSGIVMQNADRIWQLHSFRMNLPIFGTSLFNYYFKREGVSLVISILESRVDFSAIGTAMSVKLSQRVAARQMQIDRIMKEIIRLETKLAQVGTPVEGLITQIEPITPPVPGQLSSPLWAVGQINIWVPDANDPTYSGSPYWRRANTYAPVH